MLDVLDRLPGGQAIVISYKIGACSARTYAGTDELTHARTYAWRLERIMAVVAYTEDSCPHTHTHAFMRKHARTQTRAHTHTCRREEWK